jgi:hypothetical protein
VFDICANRRCGAPFDYRKGRLFRFSYQLHNVSPEAGHAVVHFWLCAKCCKTYTLEYREKSGTAVLRLKYPPGRTRESRPSVASRASRPERREHLIAEVKATAA